MAYEVTSKSTMHGLSTPHGYGTPHRYPKADASLEDLFIDITKSLYPTGRAWQMSKFSTFERLHVALNTSQLRLVEQANSIINSALPDNDLFLKEDASFLEYKLGLLTSLGVSLENRKAALLRKISFPANIKARQHPFYIESQLQLAGFNVYVHENTVPYKNPSDIIALSLNSTQHGGDTQHGDSTQHGSGSFQVIANSINENEVYSVGGDDNLYATFFIAGADISETAIVPQSRQREFRELVLKLKPAQTVAFLLINFV